MASPARMRYGQESFAKIYLPQVLVSMTRTYKSQPLDRQEILDPNPNCLCDAQARSQSDTGIQPLARAQFSGRRNHKTSSDVAS